MTASGAAGVVTIGGPAVAVDPGVTVEAADTDLTGATVSISSGTLQSGDLLNFTNQNGISGSYAGGVLTLTGTATPAQYQAALQSITFSTTSTTTAARAISIVVLDGSQISDPAAESVSVTVFGSVVTIKTLHSFDSPNEYSPQSPLLAVGSLVFGTISQGGSDNDGVLFSMNADGSNYQVLHTFTGSAGDGANPIGNLTLVGSTLYGTTDDGGSGGYSNGAGTIFSINTDGTGYKILYSFDDNFDDGVAPVAGLVLCGTTLYGMTSSGGTLFGGTVFSINTDGSDYQTIHSFTEAAGTGFWPASPLTVVGSTLFGTTSSGGANDDGTIFSVNTDGSDYQQLYSFDTSGGGPGLSGLTLVGSTLYGTTDDGGSGGYSNGAGTIFSINTDGTGFKTLYSFGASGTDGQTPVAGLTLVGSTLYGTTQYGGSEGDGGTIFSINPDGSNYQTLGSFPQTDDGADFPTSPLTLDGSILLGVTGRGGSAGDGAIFSVSGATPSFIVTASNGAPIYALAGPPVALDGGLLVNSSDADLTGATVTISAGTLEPGDVLNFTNQNGISGNYAAGVLTLTGTATPAQYQAALQSITFSTTSTNITTRSISIVADDGNVSSNSAAEQMVIAAPTITPSGTTNTFLIGGAAVAVDSGVVVSYSQPDLTGITLTISAGTLEPGDTLNFTDQDGSGITGSYSGGMLT